MLAVDRQKKILQILNETDVVKVTELARRFSVTEETIRRDLARLEDARTLTRIHGGAIPIKINEHEQPISEREVNNQEIKFRLAEAAIALLQPGDTIGMDASTTVIQIAKSMPNESHLILTFSILAQIALKDREAITVISTGGRLLPSSMSYAGPMAESALEQFRVDKFFFSCQGLSIARGISETNEMQARMKLKMSSIAEKSILILDQSKLDQDGFALIGPISIIDTVIINGPVPQEYRQMFADQNIEVIEVPVDVSVKTPEGKIGNGDPVTVPL